MGLTFSSLFKQLFGMKDMRILMVGTFQSSHETPVQCDK